MNIPAAHRTATFVSKIPINFTSRTLARLLPTQEEVLKFNKDQLIDLLNKKEELERLIKLDPARFFIPNEGGQKDFCLCDDERKRVRCYFAGNKGGKSTAGAILFWERLLGRPMWGRGIRAFSPPHTPARGVCFAEDFDSHKEVTIPTLLSWAPPGVILRLLRNPAGHVTEIQLKNGSLIHFRTYDQGSDKAEGKDWDIVWCDEPPPRDVYTAVFRGLVVGGGVLVITATLLKETWLYDEAEHLHVAVFQGSIHDNQWLSQQAKEDFLSSLTEDERVVRETGKPVSLVGVIYKEFKDGAPFVEEDRPLPLDAPIIMGVDPHERKPVYVEYGFLTPHDEIIWFEYAYVGGAIQDIFDKLEFLEKRHPSRPVLCVMDPNRGVARQLGGRSWQDEFEEHGYTVVLPDDNVNIGHTVMREYLRGEKPAMRWMASCRGKGGPIYQMLRYSWEDWAHGKIERDVKEKPKNRHKDFPDIHRYAAMSNLEYDVLVHGMKVLDTTPEGWRERRVVAYA